MNGPVTYSGAMKMAKKMSAFLLSNQTGEKVKKVSFLFFNL